MFLVNDGIKRRELRVKGYLRKEPIIAVLFAAGNLEWTLYRAIISLAPTPNVKTRKEMSSVYGLARYKEYWCEKIAIQPGDKRLPDVITKWAALKDAFNLRNRLIHGRDRCTYNMAAPKVKVMLQAAEEIHNYCLLKGINLDKRLPIRRKKTSNNVLWQSARHNVTGISQCLARTG